MTASMIDTMTGHWTLLIVLKSKVSLAATELWLVSQGVPSEAGHWSVDRPGAVLLFDTLQPVCAVLYTTMHQQEWGNTFCEVVKYSLNTFQLRDLVLKISWSVNSLACLTHVREIQLFFIVVQYNWYSWYSIRSWVSGQSPSKGLSAYQANLT